MHRLPASQSWFGRIENQRRLPVIIGAVVIGFARGSIGGGGGRDLAFHFGSFVRVRWWAATSGRVAGLFGRGLAPAAAWLIEFLPARRLLHMWSRIPFQRPRRS
jgi:hypothetical protein